MKFLSLASVALLLVGATPTFPQAQETGQVVRPAKVATIVSRAENFKRSYPATVEPSSEIELSFRVSGQVIDLPVRASTRVEEGDLLAQIDKRDFQSRLSQLQGQRDQALAELQALRSGAREEDIAALQAAVDSAQAQFVQTRESLARTEDLFSRGVSTKAQVEAAQADFRVAEANLRAQQEQLRIGQVGGRPEEIAAAEAALRGLEAQVRSAEDSLVDTSLRAPFKGIIARRDIDQFENVQAGQTVLLLQGLNVVHLAFDIPGPDVVEFTRLTSERVKTSATFDALPGKELEADLIEFSVQADAATQTYRGRAAVTLPPNAIILPGMVAQISAEADTSQTLIRAPLTAITASANGTPFVWLVDANGQVQKREVSLGEAQGAQVAITQGLKEGDRIVSAGVSQIIDGMTIRPITQVGE